MKELNRKAFFEPIISAIQQMEEIGGPDTTDYIEILQAVADASEIISAAIYKARAEHDIFARVVTEGRHGLVVLAADGEEQEPRTCEHLGPTYWAIVPRSEPRDEYAAGYDANVFCCEEHAEEAIPGLADAMAGSPDDWEVVEFHTDDNARRRWVALGRKPRTCECPDCGCDEPATTTDDGGNEVCAACAEYATDEDGETHCSRCDEYTDEGEWTGGGIHGGPSAGWVSRPRVRKEGEA